MKQVILLGLMLFSFFGSFAQDDVQISLAWKFVNVVEGYDHDNKVEVYVDGVLKATSSSFKESAIGTCVFNVPKGEHTVKVSSFAFYNGLWEEHTLDNDYSIEAVYEFKKKFSKADQLALVWDIDGESNDPPSVAWGKAAKKLLKPKKGSDKTVNLNVNWKFINVVDGYDYPARIVVYADGVNLGVSGEKKSSTGGTYSVSVPTNTKKIIVMTEAYYEGGWEEHTRENEYSIDAYVERTGSFTKAMSLTVVFDIDSETSEVKWK